MQLISPRCLPMCAPHREIVNAVKSNGSLTSTGEQEHKSDVWWIATCDRDPSRYTKHQRNSLRNMSASQLLLTENCFLYLSIWVQWIESKIVTQAINNYYIRVTLLMTYFMNRIRISFCPRYGEPIFAFRKHKMEWRQSLRVLQVTLHGLIDIHLS